MKAKKHWLVALFVTAASLCTNGMESLKINLQQLYDIADAHNASIMSYQAAIEQKKNSVEVARAARSPEFEISASASYLSDVTIWDRPLENKVTAKTPHFGNNFALAARQTLYSGGAISSGINIAYLGQELAEVTAEENRQRVRFLLTGHYLQLHNLLNQTKIIKQNIELTKTLIEQTQQRMEQGISLENDVTRYKLQLENLRLEQTKVEDATKIIRHQISTALGIDSTIILLPADEFSTTSCPIESEESWQKLAIANHTRLQKINIGTQIAEQEVRLERSERMPNVSLVAENHFEGPITFEVPTLDKNINYWFVGIEIRYRLSSLWKSGRKMQEAFAKVRHNQQQQREAADEVENAIHAAYTNYLTSFKELETQKKAVELATQNYQIIRNRYTEGIVLISEMIDAANAKINAELGLANAKIKIIYNYYQLKYISNTL